MIGLFAVALEGPPGAGKTTLLGALIPALAGALFFTEPNVKLAAGAAQPVHSAPAALTLWYLRQERARAEALSQARAAGHRLVLCDRNHLGVLAYAWATRHPDSLPYATAREVYLRDTAPLLEATGLRTVLLRVSVATSLERRGGRPAHPRWAQWYDHGLLERLEEFYTEHAPALCPVPPLIIDTDPLTPADVLATVADKLRAAGADVPDPIRPAPRQPSVDPRLAGFYDRFGGSAVLGGTVTDAFSYHGGLMQVFQLATLTHHGGVTRLWDPYRSLAETLGAAS